MITSADIKNTIEDIYQKIIRSKYPDLYSFKQLLKISSYIMNGDTYVRDAVLYFLSINYHQILYLPIKPFILKEGHLFWFHNKGDKITKLESAIYILENFYNTYENREIKMFILRNENDSIIGYKCKELIKRYNITVEREDEFNNIEIEVKPKRENITDKINEKLKNGGDEKRKIYLNRRNIYENGQNVHITEINESMKEIVIKLYKKYGYIFKEKIKWMNQLSTFIYSLKLDIVSLTKIKGSFDRILSDTSTFTSENLTMLDICLLVWKTITEDKNKEELQKRLVEELIDMNGMCSTGHTTRLINILSGFFDEYTIKTHYKDQIKVYLTNHYNKLLNIHPNVDVLIDEITETDKTKKENILKFIHENGIRNKLYDEYKKDVSLKLFNEWYDEAKNSYVGL